ncbi:MAG: TetR/AcrR family transcriptional regulator [Pseudomonadota bacterium]
MGRRQSLDIDKALPLIVRLFWRQGYNGLTLDQVAHELGVTKPTLFRTFGDKERLFTQALDAYYLEFIKPGEDRLDAAADLRSGVTACFDTAVQRMLSDENPPGCFLTDTGLSGGFPAGPIAETLMRLQSRALILLKGKIAEALDAGELDPTAEPQAVLQYILAQLAALSALSHNRSPEATLRSIVHFMIEGLPWANRATPHKAAPQTAGDRSA